MPNFTPARKPREVEAVETQVRPRISLVADNNKRHPGEQVRFFTILQLDSVQTGQSVSVMVAKGLELVDYIPMQEDAIRSIRVFDRPDGVVIEWQLNENSLPLTLELTIGAKVLPADEDISLQSQAILRDAQGIELCQETATITIQTQSRTMTYLPEIYHDNPLMARLLMLFDSFWEPLDRQISQPDSYYDTGLAPAKFLPYLASWIGLPADESLPEKRSRRLLGSAFALYQRYGTKQALENFLRLYTDGEVEIFEHRAQNLSLGKETRLGPTVALGKTNFPHTFTVMLRVDRQSILKLFTEDQVNVEKLYKQKIETIIESQKPAHTAFNLNLQIIDPLPAMSPAHNASHERTLP